MSNYTWIRVYDGSGGGGDSYQWEERYVVLGYVQTGDNVGWRDLLADRSEFSRGSRHASVAGAYVDDFHAEPIERTTGWTATVQYKLDPTKRRDLYPWDRDAEIETEGESEPVPVYTWTDGTPIINTAGDLIVGMTRDDHRIVFNVSKNLREPAPWLDQYRDAINSDEITLKGRTLKPGTGLFRNYHEGKATPEEVNNETVIYYPVSFSIVWSRRGWKDKVYNRGLYHYEYPSDRNSSSSGSSSATNPPDGGEGAESSASSGSSSGGAPPPSGKPKYRRIRDDDGEFVDEPQFLDRFGRAIPRPVDPASVIVVEGYNHDFLPFAALPLT